MKLTRRNFLKTAGVSAAGASLFAISDCARDKQVSIPAMKPLEPPFRLSESWYRNTVKRFQSKLEENGLDGMILADRWNIIYFSGLFHTSTERPFWLFIPTKASPILFHPGLDRDLVDTWWIEDREWYFDFPHHGAYNSVVYEAGAKADLYQWMLGRLAERGFGKTTLGIEKEAGPEMTTRMRKALPNAAFKVAGDICLKMREIKTPEEIELTQKALNLHDHMMEFARAYILENGSDATDFDVRQETERYGTELLMKWLKVDGKPHSGVGINLGFGCRAGVATAYPHPNQFFYHKIQRGDAIQIATLIRIGGYGGEGYRALQTEPMTDLHKKMWEVHTQMTVLQAELCKAGALCNEIGAKVLKVAKDAGLEKYIYHRPAHGEGMEGHQAPYLSLGDETVLEEGMMFSNEPGLYNPDGGWGYNHSNNILVGKDRGLIMNKTPLTKEWCWLKI